MNINTLLNQRYATKKMTGAKVPKEKIDIILENIRLSASCFGLQPYNILVVDDQETLQQIQPIANNQQQIGQASHLLVFAAWNSVTQDRANAYLNRVDTARNLSDEQRTNMAGILSYFVSKPQDQSLHWATNQAYIALGTALIAASEQDVDATPMEGFDSAKLDAFLNLEEKGLKSVVILPLGYRDSENDWLVKLPKVRTEKETLFIPVEKVVAA